VPFARCWDDCGQRYRLGFIAGSRFGRVSVLAAVSRIGGACLPDQGQSRHLVKVSLKPAAAQSPFFADCNVTSSSVER